MTKFRSPLSLSILKSWDSRETCDEYIRVNFYRGDCLWYGPTSPTPTPSHVFRSVLSWATKLSVPTMMVRGRWVILAVRQSWGFSGGTFIAIFIITWILYSSPMYDGALPYPLDRNTSHQSRALIAEMLFTIAAVAILGRRTRFWNGIAVNQYFDVEHALRRFNLKSRESIRWIAPGMQLLACAANSQFQ